MAVVVLGGSTPAEAQAAGLGAGAVVGVVDTAPGVGLTNNTGSSFTFNDTVLTGSATVNGRIFAGSINLPQVTGSAGPESCVSGSGVVDPFTATGSTTVNGVTTSLSANVGAGAFVRVGGAVVVRFLLNSSLTVTVSGSPVPQLNGTSTVSGATIVVVAAFVPIQGDCVNQPVTQAQFGGVWTALGANV